MREERKKSVWPWLAALLIGVPLLYVASFGPACWLTSQPDGKYDKPHPAMIVYVPLAYTAGQRNVMSRPMYRWMALFVPAGNVAAAYSSFSGGVLYAR